MARFSFARAALVGAFVACSATGGCGSSSDDPAPKADVPLDTDESIVAGGAPSLCVGVRGNGHYIITHFASMARIVETYGVPHGIAGGSSGSITQFVYESILMSPVVRRCAGKACTGTEESARVALALKSLEGYGEALVSSQEAVAVADLVSLVVKLKDEVEKRGIKALLSTDTVEATKRLKEVLAIPELAGLVNPEIFDLLSSPSKATWAAKDVYTSIVTLGAFSVDDNRLFFRPGVLHWDALATLFGRVGSFYAGYAPTDTAGQESWFADCAAGSVGKPWVEAAKIETPTGTCGKRFVDMVAAYRDVVRKTPPERSRIDDRVDSPTPLVKLVSTSVLDGEAAKQFAAARTRYLAGDFPSGNIPFTPPFADVRFGYWGRARDLDKVAANARRYDDDKTGKFLALGDATWREILRASPAEPGLSRLTELPAGRTSAGGWSDLAPVLVLKNAGCKQVVYVTREGDESGFATKIAKRLSMDEAAWKRLYDLSGESAYTRSVREADGVWCTNWNSFGDLQQREMSLDSFAAPLERRASLAAVAPVRPYGNVTDRTGKIGCTPLVGGGATFPAD